MSGKLDQLRLQRERRFVEAQQAAPSEAPDPKSKIVQVRIQKPLRQREAYTVCAAAARALKRNIPFVEVVNAIDALPARKPLPPRGEVGG